MARPLNRSPRKSNGRSRKTRQPQRNGCRRWRDYSRRSRRARMSRFPATQSQPQSSSSSLIPLFRVRAPWLLPGQRHPQHHRLPLLPPTNFAGTRSTLISLGRSTLRSMEPTAIRQDARPQMSRARHGKSLPAEAATDSRSRPSEREAAISPRYTQIFPSSATAHCAQRGVPARPARRTAQDPVARS